MELHLKERERLLQEKNMELCDEASKLFKIAKKIDCLRADILDGYAKAEELGLDETKQNGDKGERRIVAKYLKAMIIVKKLAAVDVSQSVKTIATAVDMVKNMRKQSIINDDGDLQEQNMWGLDEKIKNSLTTTTDPQNLLPQIQPLPTLEKE